MRGRVNCAYCKQQIVWRSSEDSARGLDGAWRTVKDGGQICPTAPGHKHRIETA